MPSAEKRQRHKEHRRARAEEELRRYRARRRRQFSILIFVLIAAVAFVLAKTLFKPGAAKKPTPVASSSSCPTKAPAMAIDPAKKYTATMETSMGTIVIDLDAKRAPQTVNSVVALVRCHFYDGLIFHRVVKGFVIQGGDPKGTGDGAPAIP